MLKSIKTQKSFFIHYKIVNVVMTDVYFWVALEIYFLNLNDKLITD